MASIKHPNIVPLKGIITEDPLAMILEYMSFSFKPFGLDIDVTSLSEFLSHVNEFAVVEDFHQELGMFDKVALDIASGINYLHNRNIVHRDLKPHNVLVSNYFQMDKPSIHCCLTDFGEARSEIVQTNSAVQTRTAFLDRGTVPFEAPEQILGLLTTGAIDDLKRVDVWAYGQIMFCCLNPNITFPYQLEYESSGTRDLRVLLRQHYLVKQLPTLSVKHEDFQKAWSNGQKLWKMCTNFVPSDRPSVDALVEFIRYVQIYSGSV